MNIPLIIIALKYLGIISVITFIFYAGLYVVLQRIIYRKADKELKALERYLNYAAMKRGE